jgi:hypothetical protein
MEERMRHLVFMVMATSALVGCGGDPAPAPFTLRVNSSNVVQLAVDGLELVFQPETGRGFEPTPEASVGNGVVAFTSSAGEYVIRADKDWVQANARTDASTSTFYLDVPLYSTEPDSTAGSPKVAAYFFQKRDRGAGCLPWELDCGDRIALGENGSLAWPLPPGGQTEVLVVCIRPAFGPQCTNNAF